MADSLTLSERSDLGHQKPPLLHAATVTYVLDVGGREVDGIKKSWKRVHCDGDKE